MKRNRNLFSEGKLKKRYKMYKAGKSWMVAPIVFFSLGAFSITSPVNADQVAQAATTEDSSVYTTSSSAPTSASENTSDTSSSASQSDQATSSTSAKIAQTSATSTATQSAEDTNDTSVALTASETSSQSSVVTADLSTTSDSSSSTASDASTEVTSEADSAVSSASETQNLTQVSEATSSVAEENTTKPASEVTATTDVATASLASSEHDNSSQASSEVTSSLASSVSDTSLGTTSAASSDATSEDSTTSETTTSEADLQTLSLLATTQSDASSDAALAESKVQTLAATSTDATTSTTSGDDDDSVNVSTAAELLAALKGTASTINVTADINFGATYSSGQYITDASAIRDVTINGNGHSIDFGEGYVTFNTSSSESMNLTINDWNMYVAEGWGGISINSDTSNGGVSSLDSGVTQTITFNNVNYTGAQVIYTQTAKVILSGEGTYKSVYSYTSPFGGTVKTQNVRNVQQNFESPQVEITDGANITMESTYAGNLTIAGTDSYLKIGKDVTLNLIQSNSGTKPTYTPGVNGSTNTTALPMIYLEGTMTVGEGSTITLTTDNYSSGYLSKANGLIDIESGSLELAKDAKISITSTSANTLGIPLVYLSDSDSSLVINEGAELNLNSSTLSTTSSDIYMAGGTLRIVGTGAALNITNTGTASKGNIYQGNNSKIFVNNGGSLNITNTAASASKTDTLINIAGTGTLSFGKDSNVTLKGVTGKTTLISAASGATVTIYRPADVIFDNTSAASGSKIFSFNGNVTGEYVNIKTSADGSTLGPYKTATYTVTTSGTSSSSTAQVVGLDDASTTAGKNIADSLGTTSYLEYTYKDITNEITIDSADQVTSNTVSISGTTEPNAYVSLHYYNDDGTLSTIDGVDYTLTYPGDTSANYIVQADENGKWTIELHGTLDANKILVASSMYDFIEAFATTYISDTTKTDYSAILSGASGIVSLASSAASQAGITSDAASSLATKNTSLASLGEVVKADVASYDSAYDVGSSAAANALNALQSSMAASDATDNGDTDVASSAASAQSSYASAAISEAAVASSATSAASSVASAITETMDKMADLAEDILTGVATAQSEYVSSLATQASSAKATASSASAAISAAADSVADATSTLSSAASTLSQASGSDPVITSGSAKASSYASAATAYTDSMADLGTFSEIALPSSGKYTSTATTATIAASLLKSAVEDLASGDMSAAANNESAAAALKLDSGISSLAQATSSAATQATTMSSQAAAATSLAQDATSTATDSFMDAALVTTRSEQLATSEASSSAATYPTEISDSIDSIAAIADEINSMAAQYPTDSVISAAVSAASSAASVASEAATDASSAVTNASSAASAADDEYAVASAAKESYVGLTGSELEAQKTAISAAASAATSLATVADTDRQTASSAADRAKQALQALELELVAAYDAVAQNKASEADSSAQLASSATTTASDSASQAGSYAANASESASQASSAAQKAGSTATEITSIVSEYLSDAAVSAAVSTAKSAASVASQAASNAASAATVATNAASDAQTANSAASVASQAASEAQV